MSLKIHPLWYFNTSKNLDSLKSFNIISNSKTPNIFKKINEHSNICNIIKNYLIWQQPNIGDECDAKDRYGNWFSGKIIGCNGSIKYLVKFDAWSSKHNEWIDIRTNNILPIYSMTTNWKKNIKIGDSIEFLKNYEKPQKIFGRRLWIIGIVIQIILKHNQKYIVLAVVKKKKDIAKINITDEIPISHKDAIAKISTHTKDVYINKDLKEINKWFDDNNIKIIDNCLYKNDTLIPNNTTFTKDFLLEF